MRPRDAAAMGNLSGKMLFSPTCRGSHALSLRDSRPPGQEKADPAPVARGFFCHTAAFFVDKPPACYYNDEVKMAFLCGAAPGAPRTKQ